LAAPGELESDGPPCLVVTRGALEPYPPLRLADLSIAERPGCELGVPLSFRC